jgi:VPDSG-CTERM motif
MKTFRVLIITILCVGLASAASAKTRNRHAHQKNKPQAVVLPPPSGDLTFLSTVNVQPDDPASTQAAARIAFNDPDIIDCFRASATGQFVVPGVGIFTVTQDPLTSLGPTYTITWALNAGSVLEGLYIKGGSQGGNFYTAGETQAGRGDAHTPVTGNSGMFATLSHVDFFCEPGTVPDGGSTVALLGIAAIALEGLRRMISAHRA